MKRMPIWLCICVMLVSIVGCSEADAELTAGKAALEAGEYLEAYTHLSASSSEEAAALLEKLVFVPTEQSSCREGEGTGQITYTYDAFGNVLTARQAFVDHVTDTTYTYNEKRQLLAIERAGSMADKTTYTYDEAGNCVSKRWEQADAATEWHYTYDEQHRQLSETQTDYPSGDTCVYTCRYDDEGNVVYERQEYPDGTWYEHACEYDPDDKPLRQAGTDSAGGAYEYLYTYNQAGLVSQIRHSSGWIRTYTYDSQGRMTREEHSDGRTVSNTYDERGNVLQTVEAVDNQQSITSFTYDHAGNMLSKAMENTYATFKHELYYTYDGYGNKLTEEAREGDTVKYRWEYTWELHYYPNGVPEEVASIRQNSVKDQPYM